MSTNVPRKFEHILVTGAAGFIGSNLVRWLVRERPQTRVTGIDALFYAGNRANLEGLVAEPRFRFMEGNICDASLIAKLIADGVDAIINLAAHTHVDRSLQGADAFVATNVGGVQVQLDLLKEASDVRFLQVSTDEVYGSQAPDEVVGEDAPLRPGNPYAATKAGADLLALSYWQSFHLDCVITRCCNNYGSYQYPEKVIPLFITNLIDGEPVPLYGDGLNYREWIHVDDHCRALAHVLERGAAGEVYNVSSGEGVTNLALTHMLIEFLGREKGSINHVEDRPGHDRRYAMRSERLRHTLEWRPAVRFGDGLAATVRWYRQCEDWWRPIKSGDYRRYYERQYGQRVAV